MCLGGREGLKKVLNPVTEGQHTDGFISAGLVPPGPAETNAELSCCCPQSYSDNFNVGTDVTTH